MRVHLGFRAWSFGSNAAISESMKLENGSSVIRAKFPHFNKAPTCRVLYFRFFTRDLEGSAKVFHPYAGCEAHQQHQQLALSRNKHRAVLVTRRRRP